MDSEQTGPSLVLIGQERVKGVAELHLHKDLGTAV